MIKKLLVYSILSLLLAAGCGEKKADPTKIDEATKLVANKDFEKGIAMIDDLGKSSPSDELVKRPGLMRT